MAQMICERLNCDKSASMQCPTCKKLGVNSFFCSQDCFKQSWSVHKDKHIQFAPTDQNPWPEFTYTGPLRPYYPLSATRKIPDHISKPDYAFDGIPRSEQSMKASTITALTDPKDILRMRQACALGRLVLDYAASKLKVGVTTDEIDAHVHDVTIKYGAYPSPLNYRNFPKSLCTSVNEVICHGIPDRRPLQDGDIVNLDISVYFRGFHADLNESFLITEDGADLSDPKYQDSIKLINSAKRCLEEAIKICRPGQRFREIGNLIQKIASQDGHQVVRTYCGHGINQLFHCIPNVPHYANNKAIGTMKVGNTFTIEPMINAGTWHDVTWPDNWTSVTKDGRRSAQFEETLLITEDGVEILTRKGIDKMYFDENGILPQYQ